MLNCRSLDPLITPFIDGDLPASERQALEDHLSLCPPCRERVDSERAVHELLSARRPALCAVRAPEALRSRCAVADFFAQAGLKADAAKTAGDFRLKPEATKTVGDFRLKPEATKTVGEATKTAGDFRLKPEATKTAPAARNVASGFSRKAWAPIALAASLVLVVGSAFLYQLTARSSRLMAAELAADHVKCFALNAVLGTHHPQAQVEQSLASAVGWPIRLPASPGDEGLELVGSRPCLYGQGRVSHVMYLHNGVPVSLFILPKTARAEELLEVLGHEAAVWSVADHTFVLIARAPRQDVERIASFVQASIQ